MSWVTLHGNGGNRRVNIYDSNPWMRSKNLSAKELRDLSRAGIRHPGSLTSIGYHINENPAKQRAAFDEAMHKYGKEATLRKLLDLHRLNYNRPKLRKILESNIKYVEEK